MFPLLHNLQPDQRPPGQQDPAPATQGPRTRSLLPAQERHGRGHPEGVCALRPRDVERGGGGSARRLADCEAEGQGRAEEEEDS
jgi:hypothetical protein